jgi:hypothetical protein
MLIPFSMDDLHIYLLMLICIFIYGVIMYDVVFSKHPMYISGDYSMLYPSVWLQKIKTYFNINNEYTEKKSIKIRLKTYINYIKRYLTVIKVNLQWKLRLKLRLSWVHYYINLCLCWLIYYYYKLKFLIKFMIKKKAQ